MIIRETRTQEIKQIMTIIRMAQQSLHSSNIDQWQDGYPNEEVIMEDIRKKQSYVVEKDGTLIGTAAISLEKEHTYDKITNGKWMTGDEMVYVVIHRIATHEECKRQGIAGRLLNYAEKVGKEQGAGSIRIDTHPDNLIMQSWLEKNGFSYCGWIYLQSGALRYAYEKVL